MQYANEQEQLLIGNHLPTPVHSVSLCPRVHPCASIALFVHRAPHLHIDHHVVTLITIDRVELNESSSFDYFQL